MLMVIGEIVPTSINTVRIRVHELTYGELRMQVRLRGINVEQNLRFGEGSVCL